MTYCTLTLFFISKGLKDMGKEGDKLHFLFTTQQFKRRIKMIADHFMIVYMRCPMDTTSISFNPKHPQAI